MAFVESKDRMVQLTYTFIFNRRDNIWNHAFEFEHDLDEYFKGKGLQAEVIKFINGSTGNTTLFIRDIKKEMTLKNDKKQEQMEFQARKPEKSYITVKKLVGNVDKSYKPKGK